MKLHDTPSTQGMKVLEFTNYEGEQEFRLGYKFDFGSIALTNLNCNDSKTAVDKTDEYIDELDSDILAVAECAEALYALFDEVGSAGVEGLLEDFRDDAKSQGFDIYEDLSSDTEICVCNAERVFEFWESFYFDLMIGTTRMRFEISLSDDPNAFDETLSYDILGWMSQFSLDKLHSIYAMDTSRAHLRKFSDRKFGGDLGL